MYLVIQHSIAVNSPWLLAVRTTKGREEAGQSILPDQARRGVRVGLAPTERVLDAFKENYCSTSYYQTTPRLLLCCSLCASSSAHSIATRLSESSSKFISAVAPSLHAPSSPNLAVAIQVVPSLHNTRLWLRPHQAVFEDAKHKNRSPDCQRRLLEFPKMPYSQNLTKRKVSL